MAYLEIYGQTTEKSSSSLFTDDKKYENFSPITIYHHSAAYRRDYERMWR